MSTRRRPTAGNPVFDGASPCTQRSQKYISALTPTSSRQGARAKPRRPRTAGTGPSSSGSPCTSASGPTCSCACPCRTKVLFGSLLPRGGFESLQILDSTSGEVLRTWNEPIRDVRWLTSERGLVVHLDPDRGALLRGFHVDDAELSVPFEGLENEDMRFARPLRAERRAAHTGTISCGGGSTPAPVRPPRPRRPPARATAPARTTDRWPPRCP